FIHRPLIPFSLPDPLTLTLEKLNGSAAGVTSNVAEDPYLDEEGMELWMNESFLQRCDRKT
ncbi:hypothetical protein SOVF_207170, partial [Spinacia oleracea]